MPEERKSGLYSGILSGFSFELRLDVDGKQPQNHGSLALLNHFPSHWITQISPQSSNTWSGPIWFRHGKADTVTAGGKIPDSLSISWNQQGQSEFVTVTMIADGEDLLSFHLDRQSDFFRSVEFELDHETDVPFLLEYDTHDHPDRPSDLPQENLSLTSIYADAGIDVSLTPCSNPISQGSGFNNRWNESELHDAMQVNWSRPDGTPWAMWVMSAGEYENEPGYVTFGIMFDSIGATHRNGTAVFNKAIENFYPLNTPNRNATIRRHKFRTLIHEIGHGFNLLHSWQKTLGNRWHPGVTNEPGTASFMNYPSKFTGGESAYWDAFRFQFSDQELTFLRHAPDDFVAMAGSSWASSHGEIATVTDYAELLSENNSLAHTSDPRFKLEIRANRKRPVFSFMEPVRIELKLTNVSCCPIDITRDILSNPAMMDIYVQRAQGETKRLLPYVRTSHIAESISLPPGESVYGTVHLSSAVNGWLIAEPGRYEVVVSLQANCGCEVNDTTILANAKTTIYVADADLRRRREEHRLAQDVFTDDVGRIIALRGSQILESGNDVLRELSDRFPMHPARYFADVSLALPLIRDYKVLEPHDQGWSLQQKSKDLDSAMKIIQPVLTESGTITAGALGHLEFKKLTDTICTALVEEDAKAEATALQKNLLDVLNIRGVVLPKAVAEGIQATIDGYQGKV